MKISEITVSDIANYLRLSEGDYDTEFINSLRTTAIKYIESFTGIPETSTDTTVKTLDNYEDFYIVVMILCQDMHDNRVLYVDSKQLNRTVETILNMHRVNLIAE